MTISHLSRFSDDPAQLFRSRLEEVEERILKACAQSGRSREGVRMLPVTKTVPAEILRHAYAAGIAHYAENKIQEAVGKVEALGDLPLRWSIVGHLQRNKAKQMIGFAAEFHALDSLRLAQRIDRLLGEQGRTLDVYIQVNTSGEDSKYGIAPASCRDFADSLTEFRNLRPRGLMTLAVFTDDKPIVRRCFERLRQLRDQVVADHPDICELSMGMSGDYEEAILEGADVVRVGQAIFGTRPTSAGHYWPGVEHSGPQVVADL